MRPGEGAQQPLGPHGHEAAWEAEGAFHHEVILFGSGGDGFVSQTTPVSEHLREAPRSLLALAESQAQRHPLRARRRRAFDGLLEPAPRDAERQPFDERGLAAVRRAVTVWADAYALRRESIEELVLAVDEIATNSIRYGGGRGTLTMWREGGVLLCEIADRGHMRDPLLGRVPPDPVALGGRGLWIVNHLCDIVQIRSSPAGSQVRMHKRLA